MEPDEREVIERNMTDHEKEQILAVVRYHMDQELRRKLMQEAPQAYNAWMGKKYVEVRHTIDGRKVRD